MKPAKWVRESKDNEIYEMPRGTEQDQFIFQKWEEAWRLGFLWLGVSDDDAFCRCC